MKKKIHPEYITTFFFIFKNKKKFLIKSNLEKKKKIKINKNSFFIKSVDSNLKLKSSL